MPKRPGLHKSMMNGEEGKPHWRPILPAKSPINPRARIVHSQVQRRIRRERLRSASKPSAAPRGHIRRHRARSGLLGWLSAAWALLRGNSLPWDERRRKREQRQAVLRASKAARPARNLQRRPSIFQRKTG
jgi:hypothetical protein